MSYETIKMGRVIHKKCGYSQWYKIKLRANVQWEEDGTGWLFPLRCSCCHERGGKDDYTVDPIHGSLSN